MNDIINKINEIEQDIIEWRHSFHQYPEVGWTEIRTASLVARTLKNLGFDVLKGREVIAENERMGLPSQKVLDAAYERALSQGADVEFAESLKDGFTGVVGILDCGDGPTIGMRFDMDALPVSEEHVSSHKPFQKGFASQNDGLMHACGHDGHTAVGLGVATVLSSMKSNFKGTIKLIFQPAEEGVRGARAMVGSGILDDIDILLGLHLGIKEEGSGSLYAGVSGFYATSKFDIRLNGVSSHAGTHPENGRNALLAGAAIALQLHGIPRHSGGLSRINVGRLEAGSGRNIIADQAYMMVETRGSTSEVNDYMVNEMQRIVQSVAALYQVEYEIEAVGHADGGGSDEELIKIVENSAAKLDDLIVKPCLDDFGGSEDFTEMMKRVQSNGGKACYILMGSDIAAPHHNGAFDFGEGDMINAVKLMSLIAETFSH